MDYLNEGGTAPVSTDPVTAGSFVAGTTYKIASTGVTNFMAIGATDNNVSTQFTANAVDSSGIGTGTAIAAATTNATNLIAGRTYKIDKGGLTDFTSLSAANNDIGTIFTANGTGAGNGTGTATLITTIPATGIQSSTIYTIQSIDNFVSVGAPNNSVGTIFTATSIGSNLGTSARAVEVIPAYKIVQNKIYKIEESDANSKFSLSFGASNNTVGTIFTATSSGVGESAAFADKVGNGSGSVIELTPASVTTAATAIVASKIYRIETAGSTTFTTFGATNNNVGTIFTASTNGAAGSGNGTVKELTVAQPIGAGNFVSGKSYKITVADNTGTDLIAVGAPQSYKIGTTFTSTNSGGSLVGSAQVYTKGAVVPVGSLTANSKYQIESLGTDFTTLGASSNTTGTIFTATKSGIGAGTAFHIAKAGQFESGKSYIIESQGSGTDFTKIGASNNSVNTIFIATGIGSGTGTATLYSPAASGTIPGVDWEKAGYEEMPLQTAKAVSGDYKVITDTDTIDRYKTFTELNDAQKQAVLNATGYMKLYAFKYGNVQLIRTLNGNPTTTNLGLTNVNVGGTQEITETDPITGKVKTYFIHNGSANTVIETDSAGKKTIYFNQTGTTNELVPNWLKPTKVEAVVYNIPVAGWRDKYIQMPKDAYQDIANVVSQNVARYLTDDNYPVIYKPEVPAVIDPVTGNITKAKEEAYFALSDVDNAKIQVDTWTADGTNSGSWNQLSAVVHPSGELVGRYKDDADVRYSQVNSNFVSADQPQTNINASGEPNNTWAWAASTTNIGENAFAFSKLTNSPHNLVDDGAANWDVTYKGATGNRIFEISPTTDGTNTDILRDPNWVWEATQTLQNAAAAYQNGRYTDLINAFDTYVDVLEPTGDTSAVTEILKEIRTDEIAATFKYWEDWVEDPGRQADDNIMGSGEFSEGWDGRNWTYPTDADKAQNRWTTKSSDGTMQTRGWGGWSAASKTEWQVYEKAWTSAWFYVEWYIRGRNEINNEPILQDKRDYEYLWESKWHPIFDQRISLDYKLTTNSKVEYDYSPIFDTSTIQVPVVKYQNFTLWKKEPTMGTQTRLETKTELIDGSIMASDIETDSLTAANITISAGKNIDVTGKMSATNNLQLTAATTLNLGVDKTAQSNLAALNITLEGTNVNLSEGVNVAASAKIDIQAERDAKLDGVLKAQTTLATLAGRNVTVTGEIEAVNSITLNAGDFTQATSQSGSVSVQGKTVTLSDNSTELKSATLKVTAAAGDISLRAGNSGGSILMSHAQITSPLNVNLTALSGKITQNSADLEGEITTGVPTTERLMTGLIKTQNLTAQAERGLAINTEIDLLNAELDSAGNIDIVNNKALTIEKLIAENGAVNVKAFGSVTVANLGIEARGGNDRNDISIQTVKKENETEPVNLTFNKILTNDRGDITLDIQGLITGSTGHLLTADVLDVSVADAITLNTSVNKLKLQTTKVGNAAINQAAKDVILERVYINDGSLNVVAGGKVELADVRSQSNRDENDIAIDATGDIAIRYVTAGIYLESGQNTLATETTFVNGVETVTATKTVTEISSAGDISLKSGGKIYESFIDSTPDVIADVLTLDAATGIVNLQVAINQLDAQSTAGDIQVSDVDGNLELYQGLLVTQAKGATTGSTITLTADKWLNVGRYADAATGMPAVDGKVTAGTIRLVSNNESVTVAKPSTGETLNYTSGIAFNAKKVVDLYKVFLTDPTLPAIHSAPNLIEYRAGDDFYFRNNGTPSSALPQNITASTIIIETSAPISINGTLSASEKLELVSGANVTITGNIVAIPSDADGKIGNMIIKAKGTRNATTSVLKVQADGTYTSVPETTTGNINIRTTGIAAENFEIRALNDIFVGLLSDFDLTGFIGGVENFDPARNITLHIGQMFDSSGNLVETKNKNLRVRGGIVAATQKLDLKAQSVNTDQSSVFIGTDLDVKTFGNVSAGTGDGAILLNTLVVNVNAVSTGSGSITINEADDVNLNNVLANNGNIAISSGGVMNALLVEGITDAAGNNITLNAAKNLYVDYVEAGKNTGAQKAASNVTLDSGSTILEYGSGDVGTDVFGTVVTMRGNVAGKRIAVASDVGTQGATDVEYRYTAAEGTGYITGATTIVPVANDSPISVTGSGVVIIPKDATTPPPTISASDSLSIVSLPTYTAGSTASLSAGTDASDDLVVVSDINIGSTGTMNLSAGGNITLGGTVTAGTLNVAAGTDTGEDLALKTKVSNLAIDMNNGGNLVVQQEGNITITKLEMPATNGGDVSLIVEGNITINEISGDLSNVNIIATGSITLPTNDAVVFKAQEVTLEAGGTGGITGRIEADSLDLKTDSTQGGVIALTIIADSADINKAVTINTIQNNPAVNFSIDAGRSVVLDAPLTTSGSATIDLTTTAGALTVNQSLTAQTGVITLDANAGINLSAETTIKSDALTDTDTEIKVNLSSENGAIVMRDETVVDSGKGLMKVEAQQTVTIGKLKTTNKNPLKITSKRGAVLDGGDSPVDIYAPTAKLEIRSVGGIGTTAGTGGSIEILVKELDIVNEGGGDIALEHIDDATNSSGALLDEVDGLIIRRIENIVGTGGLVDANVPVGSISIYTADDAITLDGNIISEANDAKTIVLYAGDAFENTTATKIDLIGGIQTAGAGVEITADDGDITFTNYNMTDPDTLTRVANLTKGIEVLGAGNIKITSLQGSIINDKNLSIVEALFPKTTISTGESLLLLNATPISGYASSNADLDWAITNTKFVVDTSNQQIKLADLTDEEMLQHGLKNGEIIGWKITGTETWKAFNPQIDWALQNKKFVTDMDTGELKFGNLEDYEKTNYQIFNNQEIRVDDDVVIRNAEGSFIQTTGGGLELTAKYTIGQPVAGFKYSPLSLFIDAKKLLVTSTERETSSIISVGSVEVVGNDKAGSAAGSTEIMTMNNTGSAASGTAAQSVTNPVDAAGQDIKLVGDTVKIDADVRSAGATITLHPTDDRQIIVGGNIELIDGKYVVSTTEFGKIQDGFEQIVIGSEIGANKIEVTDTITFNDSLTINAPAIGGEIIISGDLIGAKDAEFVINGSGHTTLLSADISAKSHITINDSLKVTGERKISATQGDIILGGNAAHFLEGDNLQGDDTLILRASNGDVFVNAQIDGTDALEKLSITKAKNVTFNEKVTIDGNLSINASGHVTFNSALGVRGNVIIRGAEQVTLGEKVIETDGQPLRLIRSTDVVKSLENTVSYYDKAGNDIFYFWTENVRL